ncbi:MAG: AMP-binding protein [Alphaproteobacteria bacterium]|nr:AMP-binding protein [Alphaproteobacteria bacterium]
MRNESTTAAIFEVARADPGRVALIEADRSYNYVTLAHMIAAAVARFGIEALPAGANAIIQARTYLDSWAIVLALRSLGLNTLFVQNAEIAAELNLRDVACVVLQGSNWSMQAAARLGRPIVLAEDFFEFERAKMPVPTAPPAEGPLGGFFMFTSGTTGHYKKVFYSGKDEAERNRWRARVYDLDRNAIFHLANFGLWTALGARNPPAVWSQGGCVVYGGTNSPDFLRHRPTVAALTPAMLAEVLKVRGGTAEPDANLVLNVTGGFLPLNLAELAVRRLTLNVDVLFGSTEVNAMMRSRFRSIDDLHWLRPGDHGFEVADASGKAARPDEEGFLRARLHSYDCTGYLDDAETSARFFRGGYFYPGDLAVRRADGRIRILGRAEDVLNLQGRKLAVAPIEERIQRRLSVRSVCLFSAFGSDGKDQLVIALECDRQPAKADLAEVAKEFPSCERVRFVAMRAFPRTTAGMQKVRRQALRKLVFDGGRDRD